MIFQNTTAQKRRLPENILGRLDGGVLVISEELCETEGLMILKKLQKAIVLGFDSCIVIHAGTFATRKLNP